MADYARGRWQPPDRLACPSTSLCAATGLGGVIATAIKPGRRGATWHTARVDAGTFATALSCPSTSACVAVDAAGTAIVGRGNSKRRRARFGFTARGPALGFECRLTRGHHTKRARFKRCRSPKTYKRLRAGRYTFTVRAVGAGGPDPSAARTKFKIGL